MVRGYLSGGMGFWEPTTSRRASPMCRERNAWPRREAFKVGAHRLEGTTWVASLCAALQTGLRVE